MSEEDEPTQQGGLGASQSTRSAWTHSSRFRSLLGGSSSGKGRRSRSVPAVDTFAAGLAEDAGGSSAAGPRPMPRGLGSGSRLSGLGRWLSSRRSRGTMSGSQTTFDEDGLRDTFDMNFRELMPFSSAAAQAIGSYSKRVLFTSLAIIWGYNILCLALYRQVFEQHWTMLDAAEFMAATVHTVGYGNLQPSSQGSRMFTIFTAIFGLLIAAHLVAGLQEREKLPPGQEGDYVEKHAQGVTTSFAAAHPAAPVPARLDIDSAVDLVAAGGPRRGAGVVARQRTVDHPERGRRNADGL